MADERRRMRSEELVSAPLQIPKRMKDSLTLQAYGLRLPLSAPTHVCTVGERGCSLEGEGEAPHSSTRSRRRRVGGEGEGETHPSEDVKSFMRSVSASVVETRKRVDWLEEGLNQQRIEAKRAKSTMRALSDNLEKAKAQSELINQLSQENRQLAADMREVKGNQKMLLEMVASQRSMLSTPAPPTGSSQSGSSSDCRPQWFSCVDCAKLPEVSTQNTLQFLPQMAGSWDRIGVGLGLGDKVKCIRHDPGDAESKLLVVMETWIEKGDDDVTWKRLLDVLWDVELRAVARRIEEAVGRDAE